MGHKLNVDLFSKSKGNNHLLFKIRKSRRMFPRMLKKRSGRSFWEESGYRELVTREMGVRVPRSSKRDEV